MLVQKTFSRSNTKYEMSASIFARTLLRNPLIVRSRGKWMHFIRWERQSLVGLVWRVFAMEKAQWGLEKNERERIDL